MKSQLFNLLFLTLLVVVVSVKGDSPLVEGQCGTKNDSCTDCVELKNQDGEQICFFVTTKLVGSGSCVALTSSLGDLTQNGPIIIKTQEECNENGIGGITTIYPPHFDPDNNGTTTEAPSSNTTTTTTPEPETTTIPIDPSDNTTTTTTTTKSTTTTTKSTTTSTKSTSTTTKSSTSTTVSPTPGPTPIPPSGKSSFDGWSFFGGILLTLGFFTIGFVGMKYYRIRINASGESNYNQF